MICARCLSRLSRAPLRRSTQLQPISSSQQQCRSLSRTTVRLAGNPPARPAAQPFTTPTAMSDGKAPSESSEKTEIMSSVPAGTPLRGLNIFKDKESPLAMEDSAYPDWLWSILDEVRGKTDGAASTGQLSKKAAKKAARKAAKMAKPVEVVVPLYEQSVDLPASDGSQEGIAESVAARTELTKAMRIKRRASIKESNFLKTMR